jgi:hypothetical protein
MKSCLKIFFFIFLNTINPSYITASEQDTAEIITAFLRGPAAYYEFKLRNDCSRGAYIKRAAIHFIRFINDCGAAERIEQTKNESLSALFSVPLNYINLQTAVIMSLQDNNSKGNKNGQQPKITTEQCKLIGDEYEKLGTFVLPILEMLCALIRTQKISPACQPSGLPNINALIANIGLDLTRLTQFFLINFSNDPKKRKAFVFAFIMLCIITTSIEISDFHNQKVRAYEYEKRRQREESRKQYNAQAQEKEDLITMGFQPDKTYTKNEIRKQYLRLAKAIHPDKTLADTNEQFAKILAAYQRLYGLD